jgi:hypothetical protein
MDMNTSVRDDNFTTRRWSGLTVDSQGGGGVITLINAGLDERNGEVIAHGWIDIGSINLLRVDNYQREVLHEKRSSSSMQRALANGTRLPDIMLGMRGEHIKFPKGSSECLLLDPVYIVDGLQRVFAIKHYLERHPDEVKTVRIGAEVRFGTTRDSEKELFNTLNTQRTPVSPNVLLRNYREENTAILVLYNISTVNKNSALYQRVCWNQRVARGELISATNLARVAKSLHAANVGSGKISHLAAQLEVFAGKVSLYAFRENVTEFFEVIDACFGIRTIEVTQKATQLHGNFLIALSNVFASHEDFWNKNRLFLTAPMKRRLAQFPINDPEIMRLAGAGNSATPLLVQYLIEHFNHGKHTKGRLRKRNEEE